jgi:hypothetical protein
LSGFALMAWIFSMKWSSENEFQTKSDQIARSSLTNALTQNPVFDKLPNKRWGLLEW